MQLTNSIVNKINPFPSNEKFQDNPISEDIWFNIFSYLPISDLCTLKLTCRQWKRIASDPKLWEEIFKEKFKSWIFPEDPTANLAKLYYDSQRMFKEPENLRLVEFKTFNTPNDNTYFSDMDNHILVAADSKNCRVWDLKSGELLIETTYIYPTPLIKNGKLFLNTKMGIAIWDIEQKTCEVLQTVRYIRKMIVQENILFCAYANKVEIFDVETKQKITHLNVEDFGLEESFEITDLAVENDQLLIQLSKWFSYKYVLWDLTNNSLIKCMDIPQKSTTWSFKNKTLVIVNEENIEIFDVKTENKITTEKDKDFKLSKFVASKLYHGRATWVVHNENHLAIKENNGLVKIWNIKDGKSEWLFYPWTHKFGIMRIILCANTLITASADSIKLWDLRIQAKGAKLFCHYPLKYTQNKSGAADTYEFQSMNLFDNQLVVHLKNRVVVLLITNQKPQKSTPSKEILPIRVISKGVQKLKDKMSKK